MGWEEFFLGVVGGLVATLTWTALALFYLWGLHQHRYGGLEGTFHARLKATNRVHWLLRLEVSGNRLGVTGTDPENERRTFEGEIVMSKEIAMSGRGHYERNDEPDAFGFWEVQVLDDDHILVIETWAESDGRTAVISGYLWERVG